MVKYDPFRIAKAHLEVWNNRHTEPYKEFLAPTATMRFVFEKEERPILKAIEHYRHLWYGAFPDVQWTHTNIIAGGLTMVIEWTACGTHMGPFMEMEPTGRQGKAKGVTFLTLNEDGKIVKETIHFDLSQLLMRMGVLTKLPELPRLTELARRIPDLLTDRNFHALRRMLTPEFKLVTPVVTMETESFIDALMACAVAFPDLRWTARSIVVRGNQAVLEMMAEGTQKAPLWDLPNTGRAAHMELAAVLTFRGELIEKADLYVDTYTLLVTLGAVPVPARL